VAKFDAGAALRRERAKDEAERIERSAVFELDPARARAIARASVVIVTSATNDSPLHRPFWSALERYAQARQAEIVVGAVTYKNPTSRGEAKKQKGLWFPPELQKHLATVRVRIHPRISFFADVPLQPTAANPLTGLHAFARGDSALFAHPQVAMEAIPAPQHSLPAVLHTTGSVTRPRYSASAAGARGAFHHTLGACIIERDGKRFHLRHVSAAADGSFQDLDQVWTAEGPRAARVLALVTGDTHVDHVDAQVVRGTYGPGGLVERLKPEVLVWHDVLDFAAASHHDLPLDRLVKDRVGRSSVRAELERACAFLREHTPEGCLSVVCASNHHEHLARWVESADWRTQGPGNAEILLELQSAALKGAALSKHGVERIDPFAWWAHLYGGLEPSRFRFLERGESFILGGIELGSHGDRGPRGSRGTRRNLDRVGIRQAIGHAHGPGIYRGVYQVGTSSDRDRTYARGSPSDWMPTHCAVGEGGKRQLVTLVRRRFFR